MAVLTGGKPAGPVLAKIPALTDTNPAVALDFSPVRGATIVEATDYVGRIIRRLNAARLVLLLPEKIRYRVGIRIWREADDISVRPWRDEIVLRDCRIVDNNETEHGDQRREFD